MSSTKKYVLTGLMTALVFVLTFIIKIPIPFTSGYIHLGDSMIYISVMVLGPFYGALASGIGSMLSDIIGGYAHYALPTFVIKSLMALIMGLILSGRTKKSSIVSMFTFASVWTAFSAGSIYYLKNQISNIGLDDLVNSIAGNDAESTVIEQTSKTINNLPAYLTVGIISIIAIFTVAAYMISKHDVKNVLNVRALLGMIAAGICMVMGYFITDSFMYTPIAAIISIPMNLIQFFGGIVAAILFVPAVNRVKQQ